jgi:hypothetical protein
MAIQIGPALVDGCEIACVLPVSIDEIRHDYDRYHGGQTYARVGNVGLNQRQAEQVCKAMKNRRCAYLVIPGDSAADIRAENEKLSKDLESLRAECRRLGGQ